MASHTAHPLVQTHGLADGCNRCLEQAEHPFDSLDDETLRDLVERTKRWMEDEEVDALARSKNEQKAMTQIADVLMKRRILDRLDANDEAV